VTEPSVTLPRWFVVLLLGALSTAGAGFWQVQGQLQAVQVRLAVIEARLGLQRAPAGELQDSPLQFTPPAEAGPIVPRP
jgi:hypothetical protein